jgi:hypothetical protein
MARVDFNAEGAEDTEKRVCAVKKKNKKIHAERAEAQRRP